MVLAKKQGHLDKELWPHGVRIVMVMVSRQPYRKTGPAYTKEKAVQIGLQPALQINPPIAVHRRHPSNGGSL